MTGGGWCGVWNVGATRAATRAGVAVCRAAACFPGGGGVPPAAPASRILRAGHPHRVTRDSIARDHTNIEDIMQLMTLTRRLRLDRLFFSLMYRTGRPPWDTGIAPPQLVEAGEGAHALPPG